MRLQFPWLVVSLLAVVLLGGCGGSGEDGPSDTAKLASAATVAASIEKSFSENQGTYATIRAVDRGYSYEQIARGATEGRLAEDGTVVVTKGGSDSEAPVRAAAGKFTAQPSGPRTVSRQPQLHVATAANRTFAPIDNLFLTLELIADQMNKRAPYGVAGKGEYTALLVLLELSRSGYAADEIFLALADESLLNDNRVVVAPDQVFGGSTVLITNADGSYQCPEGTFGDPCREIVVSPFATPAPATVSASPSPPISSSAPAGGCRTGSIHDLVWEAERAFKRYERNTAEVCWSGAGSTNVAGTLHVVVEYDDSLLFGGTGANTCIVRASYVVEMAGTGAWSGNSRYEARVRFTLTRDALEVVSGCRNGTRSPGADAVWDGVLVLSGEGALGGSFPHGTGAPRYEIRTLR